MRQSLWQVQAGKMKAWMALQRLRFIALALLSICLLGSARGQGSLPTTIEGRAFDPLADTDAEVVVLVFAEEHCPISNRYVPRLNDLYREWHSDSVAFWMVYPSVVSSAKTVSEHRSAYSVELQSLLDRDHYLVERAEVQVTPECAVFAREGGVMRLVYRGRIDNQYVDFGKWRRVATRHDLSDTLKLLSKGDIPAFRSEPAIGCFIDTEQ